MRDPADLQEIENLGEDEISDPGPEKKGGTGGSLLLLMQAALCAAALLLLVFFKISNPEVYGKFSDWYQKEAAQEIELPRWSRSSGEVSSLPSSVSSEHVFAEGPDNGSLQRV